MPSLGDLLSSVLGAAGQGVLHREAQRTRGGDYLQREEALGDARRAAATKHAGEVRGMQEEDAIVRALQQLAKQGGLETSGDPVQDAALYKAVQEAGKSDLAKRFTESQIKANESLASQRANMPDEKEEDRELKRELAAANAELRRALAAATGNRPQIVLVTQPDGSVVATDKRSLMPGQVVGGRPMAGGEREDETNALQMLDDVRGIRQLLGSSAVQDAMGPISGVGTALRRMTTGVPKDVNEVANRLDNLTDLLGRQRTGAVMNAGEIKMFQRLAGSIRSNPQTAAQNLELFEERLNKILERRFSGRGGASDRESTQGAAPAQPPDQRSILSPGQPTGAGRDKLDDALDRIFGGGR